VFLKDDTGIGTELHGSMGCCCRAAPVRVLGRVARSVECLGRADLRGSVGHDSSSSIGCIFIIIASLWICVNIYPAHYCGPNKGTVISQGNVIRAQHILTKSTSPGGDHKIALK